jgi:protein-disulfide isomerase
MASRKTQKEEARERRLAEERAAAVRRQQMRRYQILGGVIAIVVVVVVVVIVVSSGGGGSSKPVKVGSRAAKTTTNSVASLLKGIPQSGTTLGKPSAPITITEYGDLQCPICADFAKGAEDQLISNDVRTGKVKLVYKSFETATANGVDSAQWIPQQSAAYAAGAQDKAWYYIETFYREQGQEGTNYVTTNFLKQVAAQTPGLNQSKWNQDRFNPTYATLIQKENRAAIALPWANPTQAGTPAIIASGANSQTKPVAGDLTYKDLQTLIKQVS